MYMAVSYLLFLQEQIKGIIITRLALLERPVDKRKST